MGPGVRPTSIDACPEFGFLQVLVRGLSWTRLLGHVEKMASFLIHRAGRVPPGPGPFRPGGAQHHTRPRTASSRSSSVPTSRPLRGPSRGVDGTDLHPEHLKKARHCGPDAPEADDRCRRARNQSFRGCCRTLHGQLSVQGTGLSQGQGHNHGVFGIGRPGSALQHTRESFGTGRTAGRPLLRGGTGKFIFQ